MLAPQKNRAGQRVYRKRDVEIALRIKELLYEDQYTIAGAKKRLANDLRNGSKLKVVSSEGEEEPSSFAFTSAEPASEARPVTGAFSTDLPKTAEDRQALRQLANELRGLLALLQEKENKNSRQS